MAAACKTCQGIGYVEDNPCPTCLIPLLEAQAPAGEAQVPEEVPEEAQEKEEAPPEEPQRRRRGA